jgi:hypothetical protein
MSSAGVGFGGGGGVAATDADAVALAVVVVSGFLSSSHASSADTPPSTTAIANVLFIFHPFS